MVESKLQQRKEGAVGWRSGVAVAVAFGTAVVVGWVVGPQDEHRMPVRVSAPWPVVVGIFMPMAAAVGWAVWRIVQTQRRKRSQDAVVLSWVLPLCGVLLAFALVCGVNEWMDRSAAVGEMVVTDVFVVDRGYPEWDRYVAVALPEEAGGGSAVWLFQRWTDLGKYRLGSRAKVVWHKGYWGWRWCEYVDKRFPGYATELRQRERRGEAQSAEGMFSAGSGCREELRSWGIAVKEVADWKEVGR